MKIQDIFQIFKTSALTEYADRCKSEMNNINRKFKTLKYKILITNSY